MKSISLKLSTVLLILIVALTLTVSNIGPLQSKAYASSGESIGVGALVILGAWGGYKMFSNHQADKYANYLEEGRESLKAKNYSLAIKSLESATEIKDSLEANQLLTEAESKYQEYHYQRGEDYLEDQNWELAYQEFKRVEKYGAYLNSNLKREKAYDKLRAKKLKRMLVLEFEDNNYQYDLGTRITGFLVSDLLEQEVDFLEIIEEASLSSQFSAEELPREGLITSSQAQKIAQSTEVDYLLVGKVISGEVDRDKSIDLVTQEDGEEVERIRVEKEAYGEVLFKLVNTANGAVVISKSISETEDYHESYFEDEAAVITSDERLINRVLKKLALRFSNTLIKQYSLVEAK